MRSQLSTNYHLACLSKDYRDAAKPARLNEFAKAIGLTVPSLERLRIGWDADQHAWSFPMLDPDCRVVGIRLRRPNGFKFAVRGGREGLFIPDEWTLTAGKGPEAFLLICEGPTDSAALLDLGFSNVLGRPSCTGGIRFLAELVQRLGGPNAVIVADNDTPGAQGACNLASVLAVYAGSVRLIHPPQGIKDVRDWLRQGGTKTDVERAIQNAPSRGLSLRARAVLRGR
jgi:hypothetical protein